MYVMVVDDPCTHLQCPTAAMTQLSNISLAAVIDMQQQQFIQKSTLVNNRWQNNMSMRLRLPASLARGMRRSLNSSTT